MGGIAGMAGRSPLTKLGPKNGKRRDALQVLRSGLERKEHARPRTPRYSRRQSIKS